MLAEATLYIDKKHQECQLKINVDGKNQIKILAWSEDFDKTKITAYIEDFSPMPIKQRYKALGYELVILKAEYLDCFDGLKEAGILEEVLFVMKNKDVVCTTKMQVNWSSKKIISL